MLDLAETNNYGVSVNCVCPYTFHTFTLLSIMYKNKNITDLIHIEQLLIRDYK